MFTPLFSSCIPIGRISKSHSVIPTVDSSKDELRRFQKSSQAFTDPSYNYLELDEIVPKEVIEHYMKHLSDKEQKKYRKLDFYHIQNKLRNFIPLSDEDITHISSYDDDAKMILLKIANQAIETLLQFSKL
jgi:hypothetical protein